MKNGLAAGITDIAATLAYYGFLSVPAVLLVVVGVFGIQGSPTSTQDVVDLLDDGVVPDQAVDLIKDTLTRVTASTGQSATLAIVGLLLALWTVSGAMQALIRGLNRIHGCEENRSFARLRAISLSLFGWTLFAVVVSVGLLVFGSPWPTRSANGLAPRASSRSCGGRCAGRSWAARCSSPSPASCGWPRPSRGRR